MSDSSKDIEQIENVLAQTQCRLCEYDDCHAYAVAIVEQNESIDRCLPGGETTLKQLAELTHQNASDYLETLRPKIKNMTLASIREEECIGCTKCIQACPVDAIIGSGKKMHTVLAAICNGCELCIPPCPVDCIDTMDHPLYQEAHEIAEQSQQRYQQHQQRQAQQKSETQTLKKDSLSQRKAAIQAAIARRSTKKEENK